ncbi:hypothetical protein LINPERPRIM_LOCUS4000, partial [Linum perenne]
TVLEFETNTNRVQATRVDYGLSIEQAIKTVEPSKVMVASRFPIRRARVSIRPAMVVLSITVNVPSAYLGVLDEVIEKIHHILVVLFTRRFPCAVRSA